MQPWQAFIVRNLDVFDLYLWFSYRFSDMFPDMELVRSVRMELDTVIQEGVGNIVQLLKNSESGVSSRAARFSDEDVFEAKGRQQGRLRKWVHDGGKHAGHMSASRAKEGKLTEHLVSQGLLTPKMVKELVRELTDNQQEK